MLIPRFWNGVGTGIVLMVMVSAAGSSMIGAGKERGMVDNKGAWRKGEISRREDGVLR